MLGLKNSNAIRRSAYMLFLAVALSCATTSAAFAEKGIRYGTCSVYCDISYEPDEPQGRQFLAMCKMVTAGGRNIGHFFFFGMTHEDVLSKAQNFFGVPEHLVEPMCRGLGGGFSN